MGWGLEVKRGREREKEREMEREMERETYTQIETGGDIEMNNRMIGECLHLSPPPSIFSPKQSYHSHLYLSLNHLGRPST